MNTFQFMSIALSMILGLGVTRLLSSLVAMFKSRGRAHLDWQPLVWAVCIFIWQIQFWWGIMELPSLVKVWSLGHFLFLLSLPMLLFLAAALILPHAELETDEHLTEAFEHDGRWALIFLTLFFILAGLADWYFWHWRVFSLEDALLIVLALCPLIVLKSKIALLKNTITGLYLPLSLFSAWLFSPWTY